MIFIPIDNNVNRDNFDFGIPELNDYLKKYARQNHRKDIATTFVAIPETGSDDVVGYYSVSMSEIQQESLPENYRRGLPSYPIPVMRIGKLAVDRTMHGRGLGKILLIECFRKAVRLASEVGIFAIAVDALNEEAKAFYLKYGFIPLEDNQVSLFIPIRTVLGVLE